MLTQNITNNSLVRHRKTESQFGWYAVNTNPRSEDIVVSQLRNESFEAFLPKINNRRKNGVEPLFPGYLFVRLRLDLAGWAKIKYLHGVRKIVGLGNCPIPISDTIIKAIFQGVESKDYSRKKSIFKSGDRVSFETGPFAGLEGIFTGQFSGRQRAKVFLETIQRAFTVEVEIAALSRVQ